jgi:hypothetical protein
MILRLYLNDVNYSEDDVVYFNEPDYNSKKISQWLTHRLSDYQSI